MCNEIARQIALAKLREAMREKSLPLFEWEQGRVPNDLDPKDSVKIRDRSLIVRHRSGKLVGAMTTWAWAGPGGKPVFNFRAEGRDFSSSDRVLILATGFYEHTRPENPKVKLKDRHLFTMKDEDWFWIAGIVRDDAFTMLTVAPGADVKPYHDRQIVTLRPREGLAWLDLAAPQADLLRAQPKGTLEVRAVRKDGVALDA